MDTTTADRTLPCVVERISEVAWERFLVSLKPWELHRLTVGEMEMFLHDDYVQGLVSLASVRRMLKEATDGQRAVGPDGAGRS